MFVYHKWMFAVKQTGHLIPNPSKRTMHSYFQSLRLVLWVFRTSITKINCKYYSNHKRIWSSKRHTILIHAWECKLRENLYFLSKTKGAGNTHLKCSIATLTIVNIKKLTGTKGESWGWNSILYLGSRERPPAAAPAPAPPNILPVMTTTEKIKKKWKSWKNYDSEIWRIDGNNWIWNPKKEWRKKR